MINLINTETKEKKTATNNEAHGLIESGKWKLFSEYENKQIKTYNNKSYGTSNTRKHKNISRNKRKLKRRLA